MSRNEEKMKALAVLKAAVDKVDDALDAIDVFADEIGIKPRKEKTVGLPELAAMVSKETRIRPDCAYEILVTAFDLIRELDLTVMFEGHEDDQRRSSPD